MSGLRTFIQVLLVTTFCSLKSYAYLPAGPCEVSLEFEYQITKVFLENTNFVSSATPAIGLGLGSSPIGYDQQNVPGYRPTYRGELAYTFHNGNQISLAGSYYKSSSVAKAANAPGLLLTSTIVPTQGIASYLGTAALLSAASRIDLQFYNIELLFSTPVYCRGPFFLNLFGGVQVADVKYDEQINYSAFSVAIGSVVSDFRNVSDFIGVGPEFGAEMHLQFLRSRRGFFTLNTNFNGSLLASYTKARHVGGYLFSSITGVFSFNPDLKRATWTWNPVWCGGVGLNYLFTCLCFTPSVELGVKVANYYHAVEKFFFSSAGNNDVYSNEAEYSNVGFFSPYVAIQVNF